MARPLRILYAAGPGDVIGTYRHWSAGKEDPGQVHVTYSGQFYDVCKERGAQAWVIASGSERAFINDGPFTLERRPIPFRKRGGFLWHLGQSWYSFRLALSAIRYGADVLLVSSATHWFPLSVARLFGIDIVPTLLCVLWPKYKPRSKVGKLLDRLNARMFRKTSLAVMSMSQDITDQVAQNAGGISRPCFPFLPLYRREFFQDIPPPPSNRKPFRVLFAGRIETAKGIWHMLAMAERFRAESRTEIEFDLAGTGSQLASLTDAVASKKLESNFHVHGHCNHEAMSRLYAKSHVVIVPTTTDFIEGFNQVVAEAVLSPRPVITSGVCPAIHYVREAAVEVSPDDVQAYGDAILKLADDLEFYDTKRRRCDQAQEQFYDTANSWATCLKTVLAIVDEKRGISATASESENTLASARGHMP